MAVCLGGTTAAAGAATTSQTLRIAGSIGPEQHRCWTVEGQVITMDTCGKPHQVFKVTRSPKYVVISQGAACVGVNSLSPNGVAMGNCAAKGAELQLAKDVGDDGVLRWIIEGEGGAAIFGDNGGRVFATAGGAAADQEYVLQPAA